MTTMFLIYEVGVDKPTRWDVVKEEKELCQNEQQNKYTSPVQREFVTYFKSYEEAIDFVICEYQKIKEDNLN